VTIRDNFRGDYYYKATIKEGIPDKFKGKVLRIKVIFNETYFDHIPGYNDLTKDGYHDYHITIPDIKIGIPYSSGPYAGNVYETSGYSSNIFMTMNIPSTISNVTFKTMW